MFVRGENAAVVCVYTSLHYRWYVVGVRSGPTSIGNYPGVCNQGGPLHFGERCRVRPSGVATLDGGE